MATKMNETQRAFLKKEAENAGEVIVHSDPDELRKLFTEETMKSEAGLAVMMVAIAKGWGPEHTAIAVAYALMRQMRAVVESRQFGDDGDNMNMPSDRPRLMYEAGVEIRRSDDETLYALILDIAEKSPSPLSRTVLTLCEERHWSVQRTALALAYVLMVRSEAHGDELQELLGRSTRPIMLHTHCSTCTCADKTPRIEVPNG